MVTMYSSSSTMRILSFPPVTASLDDFFGAKPSDSMQGR